VIISTSPKHIVFTHKRCYSYFVMARMATSDVVFKVNIYSENQGRIDIRIYGGPRADSAQYLIRAL
jgi:hypothetical protein